MNTLHLLNIITFIDIGTKYMYNICMVKQINTICHPCTDKPPPFIINKINLPHEMLFYIKLPCLYNKYISV